MYGFGGSHEARVAESGSTSRHARGTTGARWWIRLDGHHEPCLRAGSPGPRDVAALSEPPFVEQRFSWCGGRPTPDDFRRAIAGWSSPCRAELAQSTTVCHPRSARWSTDRQVRARGFDLWWANVTLVSRRSRARRLVRCQRRIFGMNMNLPLDRPCHNHLFPSSAKEAGRMLTLHDDLGVQ